MPRKRKEGDGKASSLPGRDPVAGSSAVAVAAIGASAGGLEAFQQFMSALPPDTDMAIVLILHLAPKYESALAEIITRHTPMPVSVIEDGMRAEPNHVYVLPPDRHVSIADGHLKLTERERERVPHHPIDHFMRSLAVEYRERAIGVVLSGTGNDGTLGAAEIRAAGGIVFAQDDSAQQAAMPQSVVAAGGADGVLAPAAIAAELARIAGHAFVREGVQGAPARRDLAEADRRGLLELLQRENGLDFTQYRRNTIERRILRRMALRRLESLHDYLAFVVANPEERDALYRDFLINVTSFFRDPESFDYVRQHVIPRIVEKKSGTEPIRVWVLGCSTGEEAYSVAISFHDHLEKSRKRVPLQVFATDANETGIERARSGIYPKGIVQDVPPELLQRYFTQVDGSYRIAQVVREGCVFARHDALSAPPFSRVDLVVCRNVLIYFETGLQQRLMPILHYSLVPGGFLWLGKSESATAFTDLFHVEDAKHRVFTRRSGPVRATFSMRPTSVPPMLSPTRPMMPPRPPGLDPQKEAERLLVARYAPPAVVVDADLNVMQFRGDTSRYLVPPQGRASLNLYKMLREGLLVGVRGALARVNRDKIAVREEGLRVKGMARGTSVSIVAIPVAPGDPAQGMLIVFEEPGEGSAAQARQTQGEVVARREQAAKQETPREEARRLRQELEATREYLQSVIEQLESANEELQTANEEGQSANEEMQSINEELETSREEIQSANEELTTTNDELQQRNRELALSNADLANLLAGVQMPIVMLDWDLRIRRFTPAAEKLLNLRATDVGRPMTDIKLNVEVPDIEEVLARVLQHGAPLEREVQDRKGQWHWLRVRPYRTAQGGLQGALLMLIDIDALKRASDQLRDSEQRFEALADSAPVLMWVHGLDGCEFVNRAYEAFTGLKVRGLERHGWLDGIHAEDRDAFLAAYREAFARHQPFERLARLRRADGEYRWMKWIGAPRNAAGGEFGGYVGSSVDITDLKDAESSLREADRSKDEFLGTLGHELRNPLAAISNAAYLLMSPKEETRESAAAIIERQTRNMVRIVDDLLDVSRITHGKMNLRIETVDVAKVARAAEEATRHERLRTGQEIAMALPASPVWVKGDPARLEQILTNVLGNASKFTPSGGHVWLTLEQETAKGAGPARAVIRVRDDGPGIDEALLPRVFELFVQGGRVDDRARMGVGIGLALARRLVELHGGTIDVRNLPRLGSEVRIRLPATTAPEPSVKEEKGHDPGEPRRVLLVDDNDDAAAAMKKLIEGDGHEVRHVRLGTEALRAARQFRPHLAFLDIGLPDVDGYTLAQAFRGDPETRSLRLVALTGYARNEDIDRALAAGFDTHLAKPPKPGEMFTLIESVPAD